MSNDHIKSLNYQLQELVKDSKRTHKRISELEKNMKTHSHHVIYDSQLKHITEVVTELQQKGKKHNDSIIELRSLIQNNIISEFVNDLKKIDFGSDLIEVIKKWEEKKNGHN